MSTPPSGTPLVLVNAFPVDRSQWEGLIAALGDTVKGDIIAFDIPGIGEMPATEEEPSLELIADAAIVAMREATGHQAAIWVGCSMGGYIALAVAEREPTAVAGLGLICTRSTADDAAGVAKRLAVAQACAGKPAHPNPRVAAEDLIGTVGERREGLVAQIEANVATTNGDAIAWGQRAMAARPDRTEVLRTVDAPAVVIIGENDALIPRSEGELMADILDLEPVVLAGVGHLAAFEAPEAVAAALAPLFA